MCPFYIYSYYFVKKMSKISFSYDYKKNYKYDIEKYVYSKQNNNIFMNLILIK